MVRYKCLSSKYHSFEKDCMYESDYVGEETARTVYSFVQLHPDRWEAIVEVIRTTVELTKAQHVKVKMKCAKNSISVKKYLTELITKDLE